MGASLELSDVRVIRNGRTILALDALSILSGQFVNIIGTNGSGKTTLLNVMCGLIKPCGGKVALGQTSLWSLTPWERTRLRKQIGYIPQAAEYNTQLPFTVYEVVAMGRTCVKPLISRLDRNDMDLVNIWIERVGLSDRKHQTFRSLSGGEQQKTLIARAMVQNPEILMLDEPTSNLDFHWKHRISTLVQSLHDQLNLTVIMISHEIASLQLYADRTILLNCGRIAADGETRQILTSQTIQDIYQCRIEIAESHDQPYLIHREAGV